MIQFLPWIVALVTAILLVAAFVAPLNAVLPPQHQKGSIAVYSTPSGATIKLITPGGLFIGLPVTTPHMFENIGTGTSTIKLTLDGYHKWSANVYVREGATALVDATLTPIQTTGSISVSSSPAGANIGLDGQWWGMLRTTPDVIANVPPGHHTLELALEGYDEWTTDVTVRPGETEYVHKTFDWLPAP